MTPPEVVNATQAQLDDLLAKVKSTLTAQEYLLLAGVLGTFICVMLALQNARTSLSRFRKMLFGARQLRQLLIEVTDRQPLAQDSNLEAKPT